MKKLLAEFREFIAQGNVVDLAVAVVIGAAFKTVIDSFVNNMINPLIGAIFGKPDFRDLALGIGKGQLAYGSFLTDVINFLIIGAALFVVVKSYNTLTSMRRKGGAEAADEPTEIELLTEIRDALVEGRRQG